jgi:hypothetical protein
MGISESETTGNADLEGAAAGCPKGSPSNDIETKLPDFLNRSFDLIVYPSSCEFVVVPHQGKTNGKRVRKRPGESSDPDRSRKVATQRARTRIRRYSVEHRLRFMWTLTFAEAQEDPKRDLRQVERMLAKVVSEREGERFPYVRVLEWHKTHGLHVHLGVPFRFDQGLLGDLWGKGFVWCSDKKPKGAPNVAGARIAADYLSKYVGKAFEVAEFGSHRYECAQGFDVTKYSIPFSTPGDGFTFGAELFPGTMSYFWSSDQEPEWEGPPVLFASFDSPAGGQTWEEIKRQLDVMDKSA